MRSVADAVGIPVVADNRTPAQAVLEGIVERCQARGGMSRAQREFATICITQLREDDPLRATVQGWIDMRRVAA